MSNKITASIAYLAGTSQPARHRGIVSNGDFALTFAGPTAALFCHATASPSAPIANLSCPNGNILAVCLDSSSEVAVAFALAENGHVIRWDLNDALLAGEGGRHDSDDATEDFAGEVLGSADLDSTGSHSNASITFASHLDSAVVSHGRRVSVYRVRAWTHALVLEGHLAAVTACSLSPRQSTEAFALTVAEDRTFKVWDIKNGELFYQSPILCSSSLLSCSFCDGVEQLVVGGVDGVVRFFSRSPHGYRAHREIDVARLRLRRTLHVTGDDSHQYGAKHDANSQHQEQAGPKVVSALPRWRSRANTLSQRNNAATESFSAAIHSSKGMSVLALSSGHLLTSAAPCYETYRDSKSAAAGGLWRPVILAVTPSELVAVDVLSFEPTVLDVQGDSPPTCAHAAASLLQCTPPCSEENGGMLGRVYMLSAFTGQTVLATLSAGNSAPGDCAPPEEQKSSTPGADSLRTGGRMLSFSASSAPATNSFLVAPARHLRERVQGGDRASISAERGARTGSAGGARGRRTSSVVQNKPVTFHRQIRSSGYGSRPPVMKMFSGTGPSARRPHESKPPLAEERVRAERVYSRFADLAQSFAVSQSANAQVHSAPILALAVSGCGAKVATASADTTAVVQRLLHVREPNSSRHIALQGRGTVMTGHSAPVQSVEWRLEGQVLMTTASDNTARVWDVSRASPVLAIAGGRTRARTKKASTITPQASPTFSVSGDIVASAFYYMDKFLVIASSNRLSFMSYVLVHGKGDDLNRRARSSCRCVHSFQCSDSHQITALATPNAMLSHAVVFGTSARELSLYDTSAERVAWTVGGAHERAIPFVRMWDSSQFCAVGHVSHHTFLSSSLDGTAKLWDIRAPSCAVRFDSHTSRVHPIGVSISPCGRYVATGSEDKVAFIYDMRTATPLHRLQGHTDVVSDVRWDPLHPVVITASLDGHIRTFVECK